MPRRKRVLKDTHFIAMNAVLFLDLLQNIFWLTITYITKQIYVRSELGTHIVGKNIIATIKMQNIAIVGRAITLKREPSKKDAKRIKSDNFTRSNREISNIFAECITLA